MAFFSSRRGRARLALELDDAALSRPLKSLQATTSTGTIATTDLCMAQVSRLLDQSRADWDRRTHQLSVLAFRLSESHGPRAWAAREPRNASALVLSAWAQLERGRSRGRPEDAVGIADNCLHAAELAPEDPTPWVVLLGLSRLERRSQPEVFGLWNEVLSRDRWNREAYLSMLHYLGPQEMDRASRYWTSPTRSAPAHPRTRPARPPSSPPRFCSTSPSSPGAESRR